MVLPAPFGADQADQLAGAGGEGDILEDVQAAIVRLTPRPACGTPLPATSASGSGIRRAATALVRPRRNKLATGADQALRQKHDHHDEHQANDELPDEGQRPAEPGADEVDHHGGNGWADQGASPAQRNPDHKLRAELEVAEIGRDDIVVSRIGKAGERGDDGRTNQERVLTRAVPMPAVAATLLDSPGSRRAAGRNRCARRSSRAAVTATRKAPAIRTNPPWRCRTCRSSTVRCSIR